MEPLALFVHFDQPYRYGLSPSRRQAIIWTNAGMLLIRTLATNFSEISSEINTFSFKKMRLKMSSAKWRPFCLGLNVLTGLLCIPGIIPVIGSSYGRERYIKTSHLTGWAHIQNDLGYSCALTSQPVADEKLLIDFISYILCATFLIAFYQQFLNNWSNFGMVEMDFFNFIFKYAQHSKITF